MKKSLIALAALCAGLAMSSAMASGPPALFGAVTVAAAPAVKSQLRVEADLGQAIALRATESAPTILVVPVADRSMQAPPLEPAGRMRLVWLRTDARIDASARPHWRT